MIMRFLLYPFLFLLPLISLNAEPIRILFIGNSFTHMHDFPYMVSRLAIETNDTILADFSAIDSYTLEKHSNYTATIEKIKSECWDYVVLQEQSQRPAMNLELFENKTVFYADSLHKLILEFNPNARILLFMTWGKKFGDSELCYKFPYICTYKGMQDKLKERYSALGSRLSAMVIPCGLAWQYFQEETVINLYEDDLKHPNVLGSYLNACIFYAALLKKTPEGIAYNPANINPNELHLIQQTAYLTVRKYIPALFK